jgi:integrase/recombinase XerD
MWVQEAFALAKSNANNTPALPFGNNPATSHTQDLQEFYLDRQARNLAPKTLLWYTHALNHWFDYAISQDITHTDRVTPSHLRRFLVTLTENGHNAGGVANIFGAVKAFLNWYADEAAPAGWQNPLRKVKNPKRPEEPLEPLPIVHFRAMLAQCTPRTFSGDRDRALLLILLDTGVRQGELTALTVGDVDIATGAVLVRNGKGRKPRTVFIGLKTKRALLAYLRHREKSEAETGLWVHVDTGQKLTVGGIREIIRRRAAQADLPMPGLHQFRRAFAIAYLRNGGDLATLQRLLGHSSLAVINRYLKVLTDDLQAAHARFGAVDRLEDIPRTRDPPGR